MTPEEREAFYDDEIGPALLKLADRCEKAGLSFVAQVEFDAGELGVGTATTLAQGSSFAIRLVKLACDVRGNVDALIIALRKHDPSGGGSLFLRLLNKETGEKAS